MNKLAKLTFAVGAAFAPAMILAQTVAPPVAWEDTPNAQLGAPPQAGVTWQNQSVAPRPQPAPAPAVEAVPDQDVQLAMARGGRGARGGGMQMRGGSRMNVRTGGGFQARGGGGVQVHGGSYGGGMQMHGGSYGGGHKVSGHHGNFQRMHKGSRVHNFWFGSRFRVNNWSYYGFARPQPGWFWIRYYDDALLVDGNGMIRDSRYNFDWDRYGERWEDDAYGVPGYGAVRDSRSNFDWDPNSARWNDEAYGGPGDGGQYYGDRGYAYGGPGPVRYAGAPGQYGYTITETTTVTTYGRGGTKVVKHHGPTPKHVRRPYDEREGMYRDRDEHEDMYREDYRDDEPEEFDEPLPPPPPPPPPIPQGERG